MPAELQLLEEQWDKLPLEQIEVKLDALLRSTDYDEQTIAVLHAYKARAQILQLKMTLAGKSLETAGPLLGSRMDKSRILFFIERGRWLIAKGKIDHGVDQWNNALHIAQLSGDKELAAEVRRLMSLYRDMAKITHAFSMEDMKAYVTMASKRQ